MPGRTDNEIKNYWRTRIQKHIKQVENFTAQTSNSHEHMNSMNDQASSSHMSSAALDHAADTYSPPTYTANLEAHDLQAPFPTHDQSNDSIIWSMEDFWSIQLLNAD